ncbi:MAG: hypothetical protein D9N11_07985 [Ketobacter sp.]|nr:MAG: hypothetical protein D9N11_07985 [Ketobacter sp.]
MLKHFFTLAIFLFPMLATPVAVYGAASTSVQVQNRSGSNVNICLRRVSWQGEVRWQLIGTVSSNRARTFGNVIIGSELVAVPSAGSTSCAVPDGSPTSRFTVTSPPRGIGHVVFSVP